MILSLMHRYVFRVSILPLLVSFVMFTFFLETMDLIQDLIKYLYLEVPLSTILYVQLLYLPTSMVYALPISILFSITFTLSQLNTNNELIAIYSSGVSLPHFVLPLFLLAGLLSISVFFFKEEVAIQTFRQKNEMKRTLLNQDIEKSNHQVSLLQEGGRVSYYAEFYNDVKKRLTDVIIVVTNDDNQLEIRIDAEAGQWNGEYWVLENVFLYQYQPDSKKVLLSTEERYGIPRFNVQPRYFQKIISNIDELKFFDALIYIRELRERGLPFRKLLTDTYARLPLALTSLIAMIMACISGTLFKKNALLMSLLTALCVSIFYYFTELLGSIFATKGYLPPLLGSWFGFTVTFIITLSLYKAFIR